ncbi:hypothetical protein [Bdellovibrio bacteriovorus]|uniref:hypothetical protein n=1 Tax=Bdellovibrio bacteriovorus TaxID=959 RepID=UPI0035A704DE
MSALEYFKTQMLTDHDRRDSIHRIKNSWIDLERLLRGSNLFDSFRKDNLFWSSVEAAVGVSQKAVFLDIKQQSQRTMTAEDFFCEIANSTAHKLSEGPEKKLLLFGLWVLALEARLARPFRSQTRIEMVYKYIHPHLKRHGILAKYEGDKMLEGVVKYFVRGSIS